MISFLNELGKHEIKFPNYVGHINFNNGNIVINLIHKPSHWVRFWIRLFFNAKWYDAS